MKHFPFGVAGLVIAAVLFGAAASWLFEDGPVGVNFSAWVLAVLCVGTYAKRPATAAGYVPLGAAMLFAVLFSWRESVPLKPFMVLTILASCLLTAISSHGRSLRVAYVHEYIVDAIQLALSAFTIPLLLVRGWQEESKAIGRPRAAAALSTLLGIILAVPALLIFGALFSEADPTFKKWFVDTLSVDFESVGEHVFLALFFGAIATIAWVLYLEGTPRTRTPREENPEPIAWGAIEINVALGLVSALFLCFVAIQVPYLFGGHQRVQTEANLTYAQYARQGFFELTAVSALSFALLLGSATIIQGATPKAHAAYKVVSGVLIACVGIIIASALHRLRLYIDAYGLTSDRLHAAWFIVWLAVSFAWLYFTIVRDRLRAFAWGFLLSGYAAVLVLAIVNPDALIARIDITRSKEGKILFAQDEGTPQNSLARSLSTDAIPELVRGLNQLSDADRNAIGRMLDDRRNEYAKRPSRHWTLSFQHARNALEKLHEQSAAKP